MIKLDGSYGEGGGAILRQALALSTLTGKSFTIDNIRKGRPKPGLKAQHMHSIISLEKLSNSSVTDCEMGSEKLTFTPGEIKSKTIDVDVGTAGSITLLLQSIILPAIFSDKNITLNLVGGTDVKWSQPMDYLANVLAPVLREYADIEIKTLARGYYPKGNGKVMVRIKKKEYKNELKPLDMVKRGKLLQIRGVSHASKELINSEVADRQAGTAEVLLSDLQVPVIISRQYNKSESVGSGLVLWALFSKEGKEISKPIILGADSLGEKGKKSEEVAREAVTNLKKEISSEAVIDKYMADQLIPLLGITKGRIKTSEITNHTKSNIYVAEKFLDVKYEIEGNEIRVK